MFTKLFIIDSSRDSRQTRKRLATFTNENSDCNELLRKCSSLSSTSANLNIYIQQQQQQKSQQTNKSRLDFEQCLSISSTNLSIANQASTIQTNSSPSTTSSSSVSSTSVTSLPQQQQVMLDGVPKKIVKSSPTVVNLHSVQSCCVPNTSYTTYNNSQYYQQQQQQQQHEYFHSSLQQQQQQILMPYANISNLDYRQTFAAPTTSEAYSKLKQAPPPPPPPPPYIMNRMQNFNSYQQNNYQNNFHYINEHDTLNNNATRFSNTKITPPYVEHKEPPSYKESVHKIVNINFIFLFLNLNYCLI